MDDFYFSFQNIRIYLGAWWKSKWVDTSSPNNRVFCFEGNRKFVTDRHTPAKQILTILTSSIFEKLLTKRLTVTKVAESVLFMPEGLILASYTLGPITRSRIFFSSCLQYAEPHYYASFDLSWWRGFQVKYQTK